MPIKVIDAKSDRIPFSCIIDGNEAIYAWRIRCHLISDYSLVFDTGVVSLEENPFFPIDEKNRNVVFEKDIKPYLLDSETRELKTINIYKPCTKDGYESGGTYYTKDTTTIPYSYTEKPVSTITYEKIWSTLFYQETSPINSDNIFFWIIDFWNYEDNQIEGSEPTVSSTEAVFYFNDTPTPTICYEAESSLNEDPILESGAVFSSKKCYFKATYSEAKTNAPLKRYGWRLIDTTNDRVLLDTITKKQIYGTDTNIRMYYDGLLNDCNYSIELFIETQNGATIITDPITFSVSYDTTYLTNDFEVQTLVREPSVVLNWGKSVVVGGKNNGDIDFVSNYPVKGVSSVKIPKNSNITYDYGITSNLDISENSYMVLSTQIPNSDSAILLKAEGVDENGDKLFRQLEYSDGEFIYTVIGEGENSAEDSYSVDNIPSDQVWYIIILSPLLKDEDGNYATKITVTESVASGGLYPSKTLYPSTSKYPSFGTWDNLKGDS